MLKWVFGGKKKKSAEPPPDYEKAKDVAEKGDAEAKRKLASMNNLQPEFLYFFASDKSPEVRRAVADNDGTPIQADVILANDPDHHVRATLGKKIGRLLPDLNPSENQKLADLVFDIVDTLSQDAMPEIRAMIAEQVKSLETTPPRIIERLAKDTEEIVCSPVLEFSPLLSDDFVLELIAGGMRGDALSAVGRRRHASKALSNAIAETGDEGAIGALLENKSAQLSSGTLMSITDSAEDVPAWHSALVARTDLTESLIKRIGSFVSKSLLDKLIENNVLIDEKMAEDLRQGVSSQLEGKEDDTPLLEDDSEALEEEQAREEARAKELFEAGKLNGKTLTKAAQNGEKEFLIHAFAVMTDVTADVTRKLIAAKDPKLAVSIAWRCDLGMEFAKALMTSILNVEPGPMGDGKGNTYPLSEDEMAWALEVAGIE